MAPEPRDDVLASQIALELVRKEGCTLTLLPVEAMQVHELLQIARRQSNVKSALHGTGKRLIAQLEAHFADCPTVLDVMRSR